MQPILQVIQKLGPQRLAAMGAVTLTLIGFFAFVLFRFSQPRLATLFADLSATEASAISRELDTRAIKYELSADGGAIRVPADQIARLRMDLAAKGMPAGGAAGYELFDKTDSLTATSTVQNINKIRALEGELSRSIKTIGRIQSARVHLSVPERRLFSKDKTEPRASIILRVRGELDAQQVRAIRHLVASAVDGLKPGKISLVDENGRLLADGAGDDSDLAGLAADRQAAHEKRIRTDVEDIVASVVGRGRARVQVAVELDANRIQQTSETFDPDSRVVRSTQTRTEQNQSSERDNQVSVANELPGAKRGDSGTGNRENAQKNEETVNYEISRTTRTEVNDAARVRRLSVAVLVDGAYTKAASGEVTYAARPDEELQRIATLVRLGVGFDAKRGDQVEVVNLRFAEQPTLPKLEEPALLARLFTPAQEDILRYAELGVIALLTLIVLLFVVRPLLRQMLIPLAREPDELATATALPTAAGANPALPAPAVQPVDRIGELVATRPQDAAAILRGWMRTDP